MKKKQSSSTKRTSAFRRKKRQPSEDDLLFATILAAINEPPKHDIAVYRANRRAAKQKLAQFRKQLRLKLEKSLLKRGQSIPEGGLSMTTEEYIRAQIKSDNPRMRDSTLRKPLSKLIPRIRKFDWRRNKIVPFVRDQGHCGSCWAYVATEAYESALMLQRANFSTLDPTLKVFLVERISLNLKSTLDCARPGNCRGGRHETAFNHYVNSGIPLERIGFIDPRDSQPQDADLKQGHCTGAEKSGIKAIGWDYVHLPPHEVPPVSELKRALIDYGPLVVMMTVDEEFMRYGRGDPHDAATVFESKTTGFGNHFVLLIGWDDDKNAWIIQNSFGTGWGYSCDGCRVMLNDFRCEDRGFMYIRRGSNDIGIYAAWIEAPLLEKGLMKKTRSIGNPQPILQRAQSSKRPTQRRRSKKAVP